MTNPADLYFYADALVKASLFSEAIPFVERLIFVKPSLALEECSLCEKAFKLRIDPIRRTLLTLAEFYANAVEVGQTQQADLIEIYQQPANSELTALCQRAIDLIKCYPMPNSESTKAAVFFYKLLEDHWRYRAEHSSGADHSTALTEAEEHYRRAPSLTAVCSKVIRCDWG
jgi:14-3-3 protein epsilon